MTRQQMRDEIERLGYQNLSIGIGVRETNQGFDLWLNDETDSPEIRQTLKELGWDVSDNKAHPLTWTE